MDDHLFSLSFDPLLRAPILLQGVAITQENSLLDNTARIEGWLARFPMFDWVGGRTSEMSAVGLLPAALQVQSCHLKSCYRQNVDIWTNISNDFHRVSRSKKCLLVQP